MPDFLPVLLIAVIVFIALLIVFGGNVFEITPEREHNRLSDQRIIELGGFSVYYTASEDKVGNVSGEISNGIFSKEEKRIGFAVSNPEDVSEAFIDLKVSQTNFYGRMIILVNGKEIYSDYPPVGEKLIGIDTSLLKKDNILEIKAESSGWRIWAPTIYDFSSVITVDYIGKKTKSFDFELSDLEFDNMVKARVVVFGNRLGPGNLNVLVNGVKVYSGVTTVYKDFSTDALREGNNTIDFYTEPNSTYDISTSQLIVFFE